MSYEIIPVDDKRTLKKFINLPWEIYGQDPHWVPPLKLAVQDILNPSHPFYEKSEIKMWIALDNGVTCGRVAGIINPVHNKFHAEKVGFFGFFECNENLEIANLLLGKVERYLKMQGMEICRGPISPSTNYECGLLVEGFDDPPQIMMTYNPKYYVSILENAGFKKSKDLLAYVINPDCQLPEKVLKVASYAERSRRITWRSINKSKWDSEIDLMLDIYNDAWEKNWGFVPMSEAEFKHTANDLKSICDANLILFVEVAGETVGFLVALPDYNQVFHKIPNGKLLPFGIFKLLNAKKHINRFRVITMGVKRKYRRMGLDALMYTQIYERVQKMQKLKKKRYVQAEMSWILEDNLEMNRPLQLLGAKPYKTYRIFDKTLN